MKITVDITETLSRGVTVDACSNEEAIIKVKQQYDNSEHILDASDFCGVEFIIEER